VRFLKEKIKIPLIECNDDKLIGMIEQRDQYISVLEKQITQLMKFVPKKSSDDEVPAED
jgi:hypothetical protein